MPQPKRRTHFFSGKEDGCSRRTWFYVNAATNSARRSYRQDVCDLRRALIDEAMLIEPTAEDVELAWAAYERAEAAQAGIVDHVSFAVMRRLGITEAFSP